MKDKDLLAIQSAYLNLGKEAQSLDEGANDYESEHKMLLKKLHKEHPDLGINKAEHTSKHKFSSGETHTYHVEHEPSNSAVHNKLLPNLKTQIHFTHTKDVETGRPVTHGQVTHEWNHGDARHVSSFKHYDGETYHRSSDIGSTSKAI